MSTKTSTRTHTPTAKTWKKKKKQAKKKWKCCVCCALNENGEWWQNEQRTERNVCHKSSSSISSESVGQTWDVIDRTGEEAAQASWGLLMGQVEGGAAKGCPNCVVSDSW